MNERYRTEVRDVWTKRGELDRLLEACRPAAFMSAGPVLANIVGEVSDWIRGSTTRFDEFLEEWRAQEDVYDHDIAAFVEVFRSRLPAKEDEYECRQDWHLGRTSSDLVEPALALGIEKSHAMIKFENYRLVQGLCVLARDHQTIPVMGRTHGQYAEPTSIGRKFAVLAHGVWHSLPVVYSVAKVSGPVGTRPDGYEHELALMSVGLVPAPSTQIVPRWHLAKYVAGLAAYSTSLSTLATEIRLASQQGGWLREGRRTPSSRGSSSMAQKRNPIRSERATGLCKVIRHNCYAVIEAGAELWNERDISHSSVERTALVDALELTHFVTRDLASVVKRLEIDADAASEGTDEPTGAGVLSEAVRDDVDRDRAYELIRSEGPAEAARRLGVNGRGTPYHPGFEPDLWGWVDEMIRTGA